MLIGDDSQPMILRGGAIYIRSALGPVPALVLSLRQRHTRNSRHLHGGRQALLNPRTYSTASRTLPRCAGQRRVEHARVSCPRSWRRRYSGPLEPHCGGAKRLPAGKASGVTPVMDIRQLWTAHEWPAFRLGGGIGEHSLIPWTEEKGAAVPLASPRRQ